MADALEERLRAHNRAFEGLMSLIPAKHYYGEDTSDQWQRKKQTKEQKRAAKKAKLDPASQKSAKDVMDENERKRKREMDGEDEDTSDVDGPGREKPGEGLKRVKKRNTKQKVEEKEADVEKQAHDDDGNEDMLNGEADEHMTDKQRRKAEKRSLKAERKKEKAEAKKMKRSAAQAQNKPVDEASKTTKPQAQGGTEVQEAPSADDIQVGGIGQVDISGMEEARASELSASPSPAPQSPRSIDSAQPSASSSSSIQPAPLNEDEKRVGEPDKPGKIHIPKVDHAVLQARLQERIEALRTARKADGPDGRPARNRQELLEARRRKEEQRKAHKKELRKQAKEDEMRAKAEAELARLRGSGSPLTTPDIFSPRSPDHNNNFSFGRISFVDGQQMDTALSGLVDVKKRKGPQDAHTALQAAQKKHARISGLDDAKKADIEEKDLWLNAKRKAHGQRPKDDLSLLKKTLKRKQKQKEKSEREWAERARGVEKGKEMRQKKREDNLKKRREEKGGKGKKKPMKKKGRPGFEGSFRSSSKTK